MNTTLFKDFWLRFGDKSVAERRQYFDSLSIPERRCLIRSFFKDGWDRFFATIYIDYLLDQIKKEHDIDLLDLRIKAIKHNRVFLIERRIWNRIESLIMEWRNLYDANVIFGGLSVSYWGRRKQFCKISARQYNQWR